MSRLRSLDDCDAVDEATEPIAACLRWVVISRSLKLRVRTDLMSLLCRLSEFVYKRAQTQAIWLKVLTKSSILQNGVFTVNFSQRQRAVGFAKCKTCLAPKCTALDFWVWDKSCFMIKIKNLRRKRENVLLVSIKSQTFKSVLNYKRVQFIIRFNFIFIFFVDVEIDHI